MIITEGLATWLGGAGWNESFEEALKKTSKVLKRHKNVTIDDIINFKIRNEFDNSIISATGGMICKLVYEKHGADGIIKLISTKQENFKPILENLFDLSYIEIEELIIDKILLSDQS
ncbi:hypothetical protein [Flavobacterium agrisoli]|uniref:Uncharacterized protein n=1 Tax=Flavobacterium agrisoli TaxID=2793066 RepID=A0A934PJ80_9FLAO|nr:hypothetical protein [Flavobacterium agrisoli]MBK0369117.1 hypothetical protein [Flavobacterium agrisoli]